MNGVFLFMDNAPDFVQDRGHNYGAELANDDKRALIEYMKLVLKLAFHRQPRSLWSAPPRIDELAPSVPQLQ